jgi:hypothetical protein
LDASLIAPLHDAVSLFSALNIPYALVGGIAAMLYGRMRATEDVDFVASASHQEILRANPQVMRQFHFYPECTWKLYHDSGVEIDIWKDEYSQDIAARAGTVPFDGREVRIADVHDLLAMKLRAARIKDDYDVSEILQHATINESVLQQRVNPEQFQRFLDIKSRAHA